MRHKRLSQRSQQSREVWVNATVKADALNETAYTWLPDSAAWVG